jgi:2-keto-3-deoxy-L-rhamnonate aldolase RhmA
MTTTNDALRTRLAEGGVAAGLVVAHSRTPAIARMAASSGYHWLFLDLEHGSMSLDMASQIAVAALDAGITAVVRVPANEPAWIGRALDGGAVGIVVPHVGTPEDAARAVDAARYPPAGSRSLSGLLPQLSYRQLPAAEVMRQAEALTFLIALIETRDAMECVDAIAAVPGLDALQVGTSDLSVSLGVPGEVAHAKVQQAVANTIDACRRHGKIAVVGGAYREDALRIYAEMGLRMMLLGNDLALLMGAMRERAGFVGALSMPPKN